MCNVKQTKRLTRIDWNIWDKSIGAGYPLLKLSVNYFFLQIQGRKLQITEIADHDHNLRPFSDVTIFDLCWTG